MKEPKKKPERVHKTSSKHAENSMKLKNISIEKHLVVRVGKKVRAEKLPAIIFRNGRMGALAKLHALADDLMESQGPLFGIQAREKSASEHRYEESLRQRLITKEVPLKYQLTRSKLGQRILDIFDIDYAAIKFEYPNHRMSPLYTSFVNVSQRIPGFLLDEIARFRYPDAADREDYIKSVASDLNRMVNTLRLQWKAARPQYLNFCRSAVENCNELLDRIEMARLCEPELMVLHIDTHEYPAMQRTQVDIKPINADLELVTPLTEEYITSKEPSPIGFPEMQDIHNSDIESDDELSDLDLIRRFDEMSAARLMFQGVIFRRFKNRMIGNAWCLEFGTFRGWHHHWIIILMPAEEDEDDVKLVDALGDDWLKAKPDGDYFNGNEDKDRQKHLAAGLVKSNDPEVNIGLRYKALYMTAPGLFVAPLLPRFSRSYGRSAFSRTSTKQPKATRRTRVTWQAMCRHIGWM